MMMGWGQGGTEQEEQELRHRMFLTSKATQAKSDFLEHI